MPISSRKARCPHNDTVGRNYKNKFSFSRSIKNSDKMVRYYTWMLLMSQHVVWGSVIAILIQIHGVSSIACFLVSQVERFQVREELEILWVHGPSWSFSALVNRQDACDSCSLILYRLRWVANLFSAFSRLFLGFGARGVKICDDVL